MRDKKYSHHHIFALTELATVNNKALCNKQLLLLDILSARVESLPLPLSLIIVCSSLRNHFSCKSSGPVQSVSE